MSNQPPKKPVSRAEFIASIVVASIGLLLLLGVGIYLFAQPEPLYRTFGGYIVVMVAMCVVLIVFGTLFKQLRNRKE